MIIFFYLITLIEFISIVFLVRRKLKRVDNKKAIVFDPFVFFSLCWLFLYNLVPLLMVSTNSFYYEDSYSDYSIVVSKIQLAVYYFSFVIFYLLLRSVFKFQEKNSFLRLKKINFTESFFLKTYNILILIVSIFFLKYIFSFGIGTYFQNRIIINKGLGAVSLIIFSSNILILCLFLNNYTKKTKTILSSLKKIGVYLVIALYTSIYLFIGSRLSVLLLILQIVFAFVYLKPKIERKFVVRVAILSFTLVTMLSFFGFMRVRVKWKDANLYAEFAKVYSEKITENIVANFGKYENLLWLNDNSEKWNLMYGKTFMAGFTNTVPRKIWKNKPLGGGPALRNWIKPGTYDLNSKDARNITSYTTGLPTESYMNFHILGFIIIPFIFALLISLLKIFQNRLNGNIIQLSIYIYLLVSISFVFQYGEFLGVFSRTMFVVFPFLLFWVLANYKSISES